MRQQDLRISTIRQPLFTVLGAILVVTLTATKAFTQQCPNVEVSCSDRIAGESTSVHCAAIVSDYTEAPLTYEWSSAPATLVYHFDKLNEIDVNLDRFPAQPIKVTVKVAGLPEGCRNTAEFYSRVIKPNAERTKTRPAIVATCAEFVTEGTPAYFSVNINGLEDRTKPVYQWTVSQGKIKSGQGTPSIVVDTSDIGNWIARADVRVDGIGSSFKVSCATSINPVPKAYKLDEYRSNNFDEETDHLSKFGLRLMIGLDERAYIIVYAGRGQATGEAKKLAERVRDYLVKEYGVDPARIEAIAGGFRSDKTIELWVVQAGAAPPVTNPRDGKIPKR